jgi:hypothetical protein
MCEMFSRKSSFFAKVFAKWNFSPKFHFAKWNFVTFRKYFSPKPVKILAKYSQEYENEHFCFDPILCTSMIKHRQKSIINSKRSVISVYLHLYRKIVKYLVGRWRIQRKVERRVYGTLSDYGYVQHQVFALLCRLGGQESWKGHPTR